MNRDARIFCLLIPTLAMLGGCSSAPTESESKKAEIKLQTIQGKVQVLVDPSGTGDAALNQGGPSVYLWEGSKRYRLFSRTRADVEHGGEYIVEGVNAQKVIDEIGDPAQGKTGYPLQSSCERVVRMAWSGLPMDAAESNGGILRARISRYPARTVFLVVRIRPATAAEKSAGSADAKKDAAADEKNVPTVAVAADKQKALLIEGSPVQPAPLWEPTGGTANCKVVIDTKGKIAELETGAQLCEAMPWSTFRYQPPVQGGHPVNVRTEVEVKYEARK